jgi:hypothetical protein
VKRGHWDLLILLAGEDPPPEEILRIARSLEGRGSGAGGGGNAETALVRLQGVLPLHGAGMRIVRLAEMGILTRPLAEAILAGPTGPLPSDLLRSAMEDELLDPDDWGDLAAVRTVH